MTTMATATSTNEAQLDNLTAMLALSIQARHSQQPQRQYQQQQHDTIKGTKTAAASCFGLSGSRPLSMSRSKLHYSDRRDLMQNARWECGVSSMEQRTRKQSGELVATTTKLTKSRDTLLATLQSVQASTKKNAATSSLSGANKKDAIARLLQRKEPSCCLF